MDLWRREQVQQSSSCTVQWAPAMHWIALTTVAWKPRPLCCNHTVKYPYILVYFVASFTYCNVGPGTLWYRRCSLHGYNVYAEPSLKIWKTRNKNYGYFAQCIVNTEMLQQWRTYSKWWWGGDEMASWVMKMRIRTRNVQQTWDSRAVSLSSTYYNKHTHKLTLTENLGIKIHFKRLSNCRARVWELEPASPMRNVWELPPLPEYAQLSGSILSSR